MVPHMFVELRKDDPRPVYRQIADDLHRAVSVGVLKAGASLPATRQLARELKLNPNTVPHAYRTLVQEGVTEWPPLPSASVPPPPAHPRPQAPPASGPLAAP